jgi:hypothetical protein
MGSKIYEQIVDRHIQQFVGVFSEDSSVIFKDDKEKLIHPGEYGRYREDACKNILRLFLDKHVNISDGFVITANDGITTQCDIIVYNSDVAPIVADGFSRMFPAEEVRMIGEVKSTLNRQQFISALRKMAENKKTIMDGRRGLHVFQNKKDLETYDTVASFLICNKLSFDFARLTYEEIYEGIDRKYWHNAILSVEDVAMLYALNFGDASSKVKDALDKGGINTDLVIAWQYPTYTQKDETIAAYDNHICIDKDNKYRHIKKFFACIAVCCKDVWIYAFEPIRYLNMAISTIYKDKENR